ncbi:hypothetical protein F5I97DRAFT_1805618 [Phlebopus sp. FC_14]|nr:hypothetical protein F5I97DRAFT_1805618 [Phlebopus sp. FC_14]
MSVESESKPSLKRRSVDVENLVGGTAESPPLRVKKKRKQVYVLVPSPTPSLRKLIEKTKKKGRARSVDVTSDSASDGEETDLRYNHFERVVIEEAKSQLMEKRCRWSDCDAILNCGYNLHAHLKQHSQEQSARHCNWKGCRKRFHAQDQRDLHLERHAVLSLPCPFAGCDEVFDRPIEVMHHEMEHRDDGRPLVQKPTYKPFVPSIPAKLGRPPERLPSYRVLPRRIIKSSISADRHAVVGPWVLWHIFSPVNLNMRKQNATMRGRPARQVDDGDSTGGIDTRQDEYDFLLAQSPTASRLPPLDDLESQLVTQFASRGLILWAPDPPKDDLKPSSCITASTNDGSIASVADTAPEALDTSTVPKEFVDRTEAPQVESTEIAASSSSAEPVTEELPARVSLGNGEEEIVERMLVM